MKSILGGIMMMSCLAATLPAMDVPRVLNYQGRLTNALGQPITTPVDITFTFWSAESGGVQLGAGFNDTDTVAPDSSGIYSTFIGDDPGNPIPDSIFNNNSIWLNVHVNGEDLLPRKRIVPAGLALRSAYADTATTASRALTAGQADNAMTLAGQPPSAFILSTADNWVKKIGDAMTGPLTIESGTNQQVLTVTNSSTDYDTRAVQGDASGTGDIINYGGYFTAAGIHGRAVNGLASATGTLSTGIGGYFTSTGAHGQGVYGLASAQGAATNYGGFFTAQGDTARGVYSEATATGDVTNYGGFFIAHGDTSHGVHAEAQGTGTGTNYGGYFKASSDSGEGVYGEAAATGVVTNYGGYFLARGDGGRGVYGMANAIGGSVNYGGYFTAASNTARAVYALASAAGGTAANYGGSFTAQGGYSVGVYGSGKQFDFYAGGSGTNYGPFTGAHEVQLDEGFPADAKAGLIVSSSGRSQVRRNEDGQVSISSTLPSVRLADRANDKSVFGVLVREAPLPEEHWFKHGADDRFGVVNALGEGRVWVCTANGDVAMGDYITTSNAPGYGQKQDDDLQHSYTAGKVTESVDWNIVTETIEINGQIYKIYLIAVVYTCG